MPTLSDIAVSYTQRIVKAVQRDNMGVSLGRIKTAEDLAEAELGATLISIGGEIDDLRYEGSRLSGRPLSEEDKQRLVEEIAERLLWKKPKTLRRLIKGGSVQSLMDMSDYIEELFEAVRE
jgi:hypothetical protein